jgi:UDP-N-acetylmuramoyl-tripeptide--D-alanyl-D-alanine ligase
MKAAIENFAKMEGDQKILLLGGMMELGAESLQEHQSIITVIDSYKWKAVVLVGGDYNKLQQQYINFENALQVKEWFRQQQFNNSQILIKGSRSMQMEKVLE